MEELQHHEQKNEGQQLNGFRQEGLFVREQKQAPAEIQAPDKPAFGPDHAAERERAQAQQRRCPVTRIAVRDKAGTDCDTGHDHGCRLNGHGAEPEKHGIQKAYQPCGADGLERVIPEHKRDAGYADNQQKEDKGLKKKVEALAAAEHFVKDRQKGGIADRLLIVGAVGADQLAPLMDGVAADA